METPWPGSIESLAGRGTGWYFLADELHSTCQPGERGEEALLLTAVKKLLS